MTSFHSLPLPSCCPPELSLWRIDMTLNVPFDESNFPSLSDTERLRARSFHRSEDALRFAAVRAVLREILAKVTGMAAADVALVEAQNRRPALRHASESAQEPPLDFNVSHSGAHGLIAVASGRRVGVDIEQCIAGFDWRTIADIALSPGERAHIERLGRAAQTAAFYDIWVTKEATLKAHGVGLTDGMQHFSTLGTPREGIAIGDAFFQTATLAAPPGYAASVAWSV
ncbi:Phosphopantetheinyl transferase [Caballeronia arationis]|jgi:4'-phosphopantetheinyl transferase|uniref:Phosphopantetheinyl transferase n=1 Tax=Caballeronia arationis TaxID=1777142 RepID=A0A7Z7N694_9BURK|nr:4'-phosphopantetheinyl transferase superfamily protein [Caballeronia arationis]SOE88511.1 Phosphopantetheinyl transferase [Caballeronia arationis]